MTDPRNTFVEKKISEFHNNAEKGTWRDPQDDTVALFPIENVEAWLRTALLASIEHGREDGRRLALDKLQDLYAKNPLMPVNNMIGIIRESL